MFFKKKKFSKILILENEKKTMLYAKYILDSKKNKKKNPQ
jgi:hypothetical protein